MPFPFNDLTGQRFGRLVVQRVTDRRGGNVIWLCLCDCGNTKEVRGNHLISTTTCIRSCGCLLSETSKTRQTIHGHNPRNGSRSRAYRSWCAMKQRCLDPNSKSHDRYGGRGITVCERWRDHFTAFLADMGCPDTPGLSIDRIDPNGNYEPGNCRWADKFTQARNRRCSRLQIHN